MPELLILTSHLRWIREFAIGLLLGASGCAGNVAATTSKASIPVTSESTERARRETANRSWLDICSLDLKVEQEELKVKGLDGTFILAAGPCTAVSNPRLANTPMGPKSTFKIPHTLIGLQLGILTGADHPFRWDLVSREIKDWNRDQTLTTAIATSCVWCFQELARKIGPTQMELWVKKLGFGNADISGGIDQFWLTGALRITPLQQVAFLTQLWSRELPINPTHVTLTEKVLELDRNEHFILRGKTGLGTQDGQAIGWFVGWIESRTHIGEIKRLTFATLLQGVAGSTDLSRSKGLPPNDTELIKPLRKALTIKLLKRIGAM